MNLVIDGPEKAGKSTTIAAVEKILEKKGHKVTLLKWGPVKPDDRVYSEDLKYFSSTTSETAIWDRAWPSEYVYGSLLSRKDHRMTEDPWLGAWFHDRAVQANGLRVMLLGPSIDKIASLRDGSDLAVDPEKEVELYRQYATRFGWMTLEGYQHNKKDLKANSELIVEQFEKSLPKAGQPLPPEWCGPQDAEIVVVGESLSSKVVPGGWLPFTSRMTTMFGRIFGDKVTKIGWTNARDCNPAYLRNRRIIISCGNVAHAWIRNYVYNKENKDQEILYVPHPSYLFRFKGPSTEKEIGNTVDHIKFLIR